MKFLDVPQSGSIAGTTHSHNRAGQYTRNRRKPVQPIGTGRRAFMRAAFGSASSWWASVSPSDQGAWTTYADSHPVVDRLGQTIKLTGQQMYVAVNAQLVNVNSGRSDVVPSTSVTIPPGITAFTAVAATGVVTLTLDGTGDSDDYILVAFARPTSAGVSFVSNFWQQQVLPADTATPVLVGPAIIAQFGTLASGNKLFVKLTPVNNTGVTGVPVIRPIIIS